MFAPVPLRVRLSALALVAMVALGLIVSHDNWVTRADLDVVHTVATDRSASLTEIARSVSWLGNIVVLGCVAALSALLLHLRGASWSLALMPAAAVAAAALIDPLAKLAIGRPRPPADLAVVVETATGYPSGHSAQSMAFWFTLGTTVAAISAERHRRWPIAAGASVAVLVGCSRVVLGVHSPTDVLGGWLLGGACALLVIEVLERSSQAVPADAEVAA